MNILLSCSGGFSSSLVVQKIQEAAEKQGKQVKSWAIDYAELEENIGEADVVLIAPQILFVKEKFQKMCDAKGIPLGVIAHQDYGMCNGAHILAQAEKLIEENKQ